MTVVFLALERTLVLKEPVTLLILVKMQDPVTLVMLVKVKNYK